MQATINIWIFKLTFKMKRNPSDHKDTSPALKVLHAAGGVRDGVVCDR